jgi:hypothetical protein
MNERNKPLILSFSHREKGLNTRGSSQGLERRNVPPSLGTGKPLAGELVPTTVRIPGASRRGHARDVPVPRY